ncbi:MAG: FAD-dependent monooxygenase [Phycisphaeraceae bacterium]|nr:FAD-dependent monooxygenase [Phycisphaerales bacterium]MCB9843442.1 FAD-dependent monooxygenase [Phycisphaeraceae bacterium]
MSTETITVFGAGLAGTLMAVYLARAGHRVDLYERRSDPRVAGAAGGKSINLALSARGIDALARVGLAERVLKDAIPMRGRMIHGPTGELVYQPYSADPSRAINSVSRGGLNMTLLDAAESESDVTIHFGRRCIGMDFERRVALVTERTDEDATELPVRTVIGADGAFSGVRSSMQRRERFDYSQDYLPHGYKELTIPAGDGGSWRIEKNALHIWPRGTHMMIALPNADGSFTCTLFWPYEGRNSVEELQTERDVERFFRAQFPDAMDLIPSLTHDFVSNPTGSLVTVRCSPWSVGDAAVLIGDACHAVVPFFGQGMNAAFQDCTVLDECMRAHPNNRAAAFGEYHDRRKRDCDVLADLAIENYVEMRDHTASRVFRARKRVERVLTKVFPRWYLPLYEMVSFSTIPYGEAVDRARRQERVVVIAGLVIFMVALIGFAALLGWLL